MVLGAGILSTGFTGSAHALGCRAATAVFCDVSDVRPAVLCGPPANRAEIMAGQLGLARATANWRELIDDPDLEIEAMPAPNALHREMAPGTREQARPGG